MSFRLRFNGGPLDGTVEEVRGAPQTLRLSEEKAQGQHGHYSLVVMKNNVAQMMWRPESGKTK